MPELNNKELKALISLLDDEDEEVLDHVSKKLYALGKDGIPILASAYENTDNSIVQTRLEELIQNIQFDNVKDRFSYWIQSKEQDLLEAALIIAHIQYPNIDESAIQQKINSLAKAVWIELNAALSPLEELQVINQVFFQLHGYLGVQTPTPDFDLGYINKVFDTKKGNSLSLGIIFLIIAQKNDMPIYGINLPYHFIMAYCKKHLNNDILDRNLNDKDVMFYINPLNKGIAFSRIEITNYLEQMKIEAKQKYYAPCNHKEIIKSLIYNQMSCYDKNNDKLKSQQLKQLFDILNEKTNED
jgi:regulator of sirC expression with transglutaminase-like and TPR domain